MTLDPALGRVDRIGSVVIGAGLGAYAFLGGIANPWGQAVCVVLGVTFAIGGLGGT